MREPGGGFVGQLTLLLEAGPRADVVTTFLRAVGMPESVVSTAAEPGRGQRGDDGRVTAAM